MLLSRGLISMRPIPPDPISPQGAYPHYTFVALEAVEPLGYAVGRSRGGLSTKIHAAVEGKGRPLSVVVTGGQRNDGAMFTDVIDRIWVPSVSGVPDRTQPDAFLGDKGYTTSGNRQYLRQQGIKAVIRLAPRSVS